MDKTASNASRLKPRGQLPVVTLKSYSKFQNASKTTGTQTVSNDYCRDHSQQITELLTEVAITLGHKAKLENQISEMKEETIKMQHKFDETRVNLEREIEKLKRENFDKEMDVSKLKISYLEEQKTLVNEVCTLKSEIKSLNEENEIIRQDLTTQNQQLEIKINVNQDELRKEADKNVHLQLKVTKYKNKFKNLAHYMQQSLQEFKDKQPKEIQTQTEKKILIQTGKYEPNMEDMVLSELFFKPCPLPTEVQDLFFNQHQYT